jgi:hypothetical protein
VKISGRNLGCLEGVSCLYQPPGKMATPNVAIVDASIKEKLYSSRNKQQYNRASRETGIFSQKNNIL